uniref:Strictosidine synthase conserved region domain-containing protein n=1 Tax=Chaetoceros debilis TaxID=122233 RepID=A0A7S3Q3Y1_9STRA
MSSSKFKLIPTAITMAAVAVVFTGVVLKHTTSSSGSGIMLAEFTSKDEQAKFLPINPENETLRSPKLTKIYERESSHKRLLKGPETPIVDPDTGILYVLTEEANLVSLTDVQPMQKPQSSTAKASRVSAKATLIADLGIGRPLGAAFAKDKDNKTIIYVADTLAGLLRVSNLNSNNDGPDATSTTRPTSNKPKVELVASSFQETNGINGQTTTTTSRRILYANDVDVGPITGHVYFSDASDIAPERTPVDGEGFSSWDTMTAYKRDLLRARPTGRLLRYKPETNEVDVLLDGLWFANGVAVDRNEDYVIVTETSKLRETQYNLNVNDNDDDDDDEYKNDDLTKILVDSLPGFPDGLTCDRDSGEKDQVCYAAMPSPKIPLINILNAVPASISMFLRTLLLQLPASAFGAIKPVNYGGVAKIRTRSGDVSILQDPKGEEIGLITGLTVFDKKLYMGSLVNDFVGVYDLS